MGNFKEWLSDNLRYFALFILLVILLVGGFFGINAIRKIGGAEPISKKDVVEKLAGNETEKVTESTTEANSDVIVSQSSNGLVQNDTKILTTMTSYYTAKTNKDIETLVKLDPSLNQAEEIENLENTYVESYSNIRTYSKAGPNAGSCIVYVCYDGKVRDIDTLVPSLVQFFLKTDTEGNYYIADASEDEAAKAFVEESKKSAEAQELINQVNSACEEAKESDPVLKEFMRKYGSGAQEKAEQNEEQVNSATADDDKDKAPSKREWMIANDSCNVRAEANTECEVIGYLLYGQEVEAVGKSGDWYKIDYNGTEGYVSCDFLSTEEDFNKAGEQDELADDEYYGYDDTYYDYGYDDGGAYYDEYYQY